MRRRAYGAAATLLSLALGGCIDISFDSPSIVITKRIVAISAVQPEVFPGEDVHFEVLALDEGGRRLLEQPGFRAEWSVCLSLEAIFDGAGFGASVDLPDTCGPGGPDLVPLDTEGLPPGQARLDGDLILDLAAQLMEMGDSGGTGGAELPPGVTPDQLETLLSVITIVGVPLRPEVAIFEGDERILRGRKRFAITTRPDPTTVPWPPRFAIGGAFVTARDVPGDPRVCVPEDGEVIRLTTDTEVVLTPSGDAEEWIETYPVFNLGGELQINEESAFYNWYATAGSFSREATQLGDDQTTWTTPTVPGTYRLWVVVRDGHLGTTWCSADVVVEN